MLLKKTNQKGFSIIEVLIVLAIAGLIMLVVFLAVPALRRNAANNGRQSDASRLSSAVQDCLSNHNGIYTSCGTIDVGTMSQLTGTVTVNSTALLTTPTTEATAAVPTQLTSTGTPPVSSDPDAVNAVVDFGSKCNTTGDARYKSNNSRDFTVMYNKKTSASVTPICIGS
jgi:prepilin-type N-terminal cleavage/methylation domain-containing protein